MSDKAVQLLGCLGAPAISSMGTPYLKQRIATGDRTATSAGRSCGDIYKLGLSSNFGTYAAVRLKRSWRVNLIPPDGELLGPTPKRVMAQIRLEASLSGKLPRPASTWPEMPPQKPVVTCFLSHAKKEGSQSLSHGP